MEVLRPDALPTALEMKAEHPGAVPLAGGTDLMVELNFAKRRPNVVIDLTRARELCEHDRDNGIIRVGAGVTYTELIARLAVELPGLAIASRTVGSPQIRNRGTIGGNLGTSSPAGDTLPVLIACNAEIELASVRGTRIMLVDEFITGPKENALADDELITGTLIPVAAGAQQFAKIGPRNAMVIAVASVAVILDSRNRRVGTGIGSVGPTPLRSAAAEELVTGHLSETGLWDTGEMIGDSVVTRFGELMAETAAPIDDVRGSARYRRHAVDVLARRALTWVWNEYGGSR